MDGLVPRILRLNAAQIRALGRRMASISEGEQVDEATLDRALLAQLANARAAPDDTEAADAASWSAISARLPR